MCEAPMVNDILMVKKIWVLDSHSGAYKYYNNINIQTLFFLNIIIIKKRDWTNDDLFQNLQWLKYKLLMV